MSVPEESCSPAWTCPRSIETCGYEEYVSFPPKALPELGLCNKNNNSPKRVSSSKNCRDGRILSAPAKAAIQKMKQQLISILKMDLDS